MLVRHAFRLELDPSHRTRSALSSHCGASRYAFNWGLGLVGVWLSCSDPPATDSPAQRYGLAVIPA